jgi:squalene-associated FAD-dependent desaturase
VEDLGSRVSGDSGHGRRVAIVGGGWSGLACAVSLVDAGCSVTVFERAATLGGRARRVEWAGHALDNGQHILVGAYRETLAMIHRVQPDVPATALYRRARFALAGPGRFRVSAWPLPAPWHTLAALVTARDCSWRERKAIAQAFSRWRRAHWSCDPAASVADILRDEPERVRARLWHPLCIAALNTPPEAASGTIFLNVLHDALAGARADSDLIVPAVDLTHLFPEPAARWMAARGATLRRRMPVHALAPHGRTVEVVAGSERRHRETFDAVVLATAPADAERLLAAIPDARETAALIADYRALPITTIYLRFAERLAWPPGMRQLDGDPGQWVFDRSAVLASPGTLLAVVVSARDVHRAPGDDDALAGAIMRQLRAESTAFARVEPVAARIIREARATHAAAPSRRHPQAGRIAGRLFIAGDHTDARYPATLEAAVRAGLAAARAVMIEG